MLAALVSLALFGCSASSPVRPLSFQGTVEDRSYPTGQAITPLVLPAASGGRGTLTYSLLPDIPGLSFDPDRRSLSGTPTEPRSHLMAYTVTDGTASASLAFTITIESTALTSRYRGSGDQVFTLNPDGAMLDSALYTLDLGDASPEVYLIATNTASRPMDPHVDRLGLTEAAAEPGQDGYVPPPRPAPSARVPELAFITEFNNNPPLPRRSAPRGSARLHPQARRGVVKGDRFTFRHLDNQNLVFIPATARSVVTDGDTTVALWVADRDWGPTCRSAGPCLTGEMVDALADRFLRPGAGNDIHDWVTAIYGDPWGPHPYSDLIPPDAAGEIHILLFDIQGDGLPRPGECRIVGFFWAVHNLPQGHPEVPRSRVSSERLIFFMDSAYAAVPQGPTWEVSDLGPSIVISSLAHEFQHMIHFYQKLVLRDTVSETWLNEMASEVAEDLLADKLQVDGPRGVAYDDPAAGMPGNEQGRLPYYNLFNDLQVTVWNNVIANYSLNYALGAYLARTYGGAALFSDIVQSADAGVDAIEAALAAAGHDISFGQVLADWAVAALLSDNTAAPAPYRYNTGAYSTSHAGGEQFRLGSINLFNYRYEPPEIVSDCVGPDLASRSALEGPYLHSLRTFNARSQPPHSNMFASLGRNSGSVRLAVTAGSGNLITVVVKE